jgi:hypothetical protein
MFPAAKATSLPFSLVSPPDHPYQPFGAAVQTLGGPPTNAAVSQYVEREPSAGGTAAGPALSATTRELLLLAALAAILVVLAAAAVRRRHPRTIQPRH